jgi:hypothetical protein
VCVFQCAVWRSHPREHCTAGRSTPLWSSPAIRVGPVEGDPNPAATLVQACQDGSGSEIHGVLLSREDGLAHPRLSEFWGVVDFVLANDPTVHVHLYG